MLLSSPACPGKLPSAAAYGSWMLLQELETWHFVTKQAGLAQELARLGTPVHYKVA